MNYLLATLEYPPYHGGVAHYYGHLVKSSPEPIAVLTNNQGHLVDQRWPFLKWLPSLYWLTKAIKTQKIDYLLVGQILPIGTTALILSYFLPIRYAVFLHGLDLSTSQATPLKSYLAKLILNRAHRIIAANSRTAAECRGLVHPEQIKNISVVNPGINPHPVAHDKDLLHELQTRYQLTDKQILLTVGRLVHRKGIDLVLQALASEPNPNLVYLIIGQGPEESKLKELIKTLKLDQQVHLLIDIDDRLKAHFFHLADIFIMTSREGAGDYEGFGIVYLEAALAGKPVIASRGGGVADAVLDNETGLLVDPEAQSIRSAINKLLNYPSLAQRLGDRGRQRAQTDFNWASQAQKIINLLQD